MTRALAWTKIRHGRYRSSAGHEVELLGGLWLLTHPSVVWETFKSLHAAKRAAERSGR
jgi:hypothetical protein